MGKDEDLRHGHRKRMKEQFLKSQRDDEFPDYQLLEMLLFYALPRVDTRETAKRLIKECGSFANVFSAEGKKLNKIKGVTENLLVFLKLILVVSRRYHVSLMSGQKFKTVKDYGEFLLEQYEGAKTEMMSLISLDANYKFISFDVVSTGETDSVTVSARKIVEKVLKRGAHSVILAHNHPSGIAIPSVSDAETTVTIKRLLAQVGVHLIDHVVLENDDFVSMAQSAEYTHIF